LFSLSQFKFAIYVETGLSLFRTRRWTTQLLLCVRKLFGFRLYKVKSCCLFRILHFIW